MTGPAGDSGGQDLEHCAECGEPSFVVVCKHVLDGDDSAEVFTTTGPTPEDKPWHDCGRDDCPVYGLCPDDWSNL